MTGPIRIEGAQPGEAVEIHIEDIAVTTPAAVVISSAIISWLKISCSEAVAPRPP